MDFSEFLSQLEKYIGENRSLFQIDIPDFFDNISILDRFKKESLGRMNLQKSGYLGDEIFYCVFEKECVEKEVILFLKISESVLSVFKLYKHYIASIVYIKREDFTVRFDKYASLEETSRYLGAEWSAENYQIDYEFRTFDKYNSREIISFYIDGSVNNYDADYNNSIFHEIMNTEESLCAEESIENFFKRYRIPLPSEIFLPQKLEGVLYSRKDENISGIEMIDIPIETV